MAHVGGRAGYRALGLRYIYRPCPATDIGAIIAAVRVLDIRGCSVSMPFKESVIAHLDEVAPEARRAGAVNTVLNRNGVLMGSNTDIMGNSAAGSACERLPPVVPRLRMAR